MPVASPFTSPRARMSPTDSPPGPPDPPGTVVQLVRLTDYSWETIHNLPETSMAPDSARLYLSESLPESAAHQSAALGFHLPSSFFPAHSKSTVAEWDVPFLDPETNIFAKWTSPATQLRKQWDIEQRIAANRPYDADTVQDPSELRLNHFRYERDPPFQVRPYHPISSFEDGANDMVHAMTECISLHWEYREGVKTGFLLFDPPRFHRITSKRYAFWSDTAGPDIVTHESVLLGRQTCRERFIHKITTMSVCHRVECDIADAVNNALLEIILEDELAVLAMINESLDLINLSMGSDDILSITVDVWRDRFGRWRNLLYHAKNSTEYIATVGRAQTAEGIGTLRDGLESLQRCIRSTAERIDSTFEAFGLTMSIVESRRAIRQAETVAKLTRLAFFFVPPTLITGVFGANLNELDDRLTLWHLVVASLCASLLTYSVFYRQQVLHLLAGSFHAIANTSLNRMSKIAVKWLTIARATWRAAPNHLVRALWLGLNGVILACLWQVIESPIALEAKLAVSSVFFLCYTGATIFPLVLRYRQRRDHTSAAIMVGGIMAALFLLSGMEVSVWRILGSQMTSPAKTAAASGVLCLSALVTVASRFVASRQHVNYKTTQPEDFGSI